jgi:hypothetical protein
VSDIRPKPAGAPAPPHCHAPRALILRPGPGSGPATHRAMLGRGLTPGPRPR